MSGAVNWNARRPHGAVPHVIMTKASPASAPTSPSLATTLRHHSVQSLTVADVLRVSHMPSMAEFGSRHRPTRLSVWFGEDNEIATDAAAQMLTVGGRLRVREDVDATKVTSASVATDRLNTSSLDVGPPSDRAIRLSRTSATFFRPVRMEGNVDIVGNEFLCSSPSEFRAGVRVGGDLNVFGTCVLHKGMRLTTSLVTSAPCEFNGEVSFSGEVNVHGQAAVHGDLLVESDHSRLRARVADVDTLSVTGLLSVRGTSGILVSSEEGGTTRIDGISGALHTQSGMVVCSGGTFTVSFDDAERKPALILDSQQSKLKVENADISLSKSSRLVAGTIEGLEDLTLLSNEKVCIPASVLDLAGNRIENLAEPLMPTDAACKRYVDNVRQELQPPVVRADNESINIGGAASLPKVVFAYCDISSLEVTLPCIRDGETPDGWELRIFDVRRCADRNPVIVHTASGQSFGGMLKGHKKIRMNQRGIVMTLIVDLREREWIPMWTTSAGIAGATGSSMTPSPNIMGGSARTPSMANVATQLMASRSLTPTHEGQDAGLRVSRTGSLIISKPFATTPMQSQTTRGSALWRRSLSIIRRAKDEEGQDARPSVPTLQQPAHRFRQRGADFDLGAIAEDCADGDQSTPGKIDGSSFHRAMPPNLPEPDDDGESEEEEEEEGEEEEEKVEDEAVLVTQQEEISMETSVASKRGNRNTEVVLSVSGPTVVDAVHRARMVSSSSEESTEDAADSSAHASRSKVSLVQRATTMCTTSFLTQAQKEEIIEEFKPCFILHSRELHSPCTFEWLLPRSTLYEYAHRNRTHRSAIAHAPSVADLARYWRRQDVDGLSSYIVKPCENEGETFLDISPEGDTMLGPPMQHTVSTNIAVSFAVPRGERESDGRFHARFVYMFPYRSGHGAHYADMGHVTVEFRRERTSRGETRFTPLSMCFADQGVDRMSQWVEWSRVRKWEDTQRPVVYLSRGTHVPYRSPGNHRRCFMLRGDVCDENGKVWDPEDVDIEPPWMAFKGRIGREGPWGASVQSWWRHGDSTDVKSKFKRYTSVNLA